MLSLIIPVYKNERSIDRLLKELVALAGQLDERLEVVFVVDGSPDRSLHLLEERLPELPLDSQVLVLSRNFGSFAAMAAGLMAGKGEWFAVMSADLQEPPQLALEFLRLLKAREADVVFGCRAARSDPWLSEIFSSAFWWIYRRLVIKELPPGGVDVFGCTREVRDHVIRFREVNSSLIVLLFWLGFRRKYVSYQRAPRLEGRSAWNVGKKIRYCIDSIFNFTDLPIQLLLYLGLLGMAAALIFAPVLMIGTLRGMIHVPGYTPVALAVLFFGGLSSFGLGVVGQYAWLALQNSRGRPNFVIAASHQHSRNDKTVAGS